MRFSEAFLARVDLVEATPTTLRVRGWIAHPTIRIDEVAVFLGDRPLGDAVTLVDRPDVRERFRSHPFHENLLRSGFDVTAPIASPLENPHDVLLEIRPFSDGLPLRPMLILYCDIAHEETARPQPPAHLKERIGGAENYAQIGAGAVGLVLTHLRSMKPLAELTRILDWGCGSGRVARHLAKCVDPARVYGCDIDPEAIRWARANIPGPRFDTVPPTPPTAYDPGSFDAVYGISVMTHLDEETQLAWLAELRRVTRPGAVLLLSVLGEAMRESRMPSQLRAQYERTGFAAFTPDYEREQGFREFTAPEYYKESFHSPAYIERVWGRSFELVEYVKTRGQDLVLMRRPADER